MPSFHSSLRELIQAMPSLKAMAALMNIMVHYLEIGSIITVTLFSSLARNISGVSPTI